MICNITLMHINKNITNYNSNMYISIENAFIFNDLNFTKTQKEGAMFKNIRVHHLFYYEFILEVHILSMACDLIFVIVGSYYEVMYRVCITFLQIFLKH